MKRRGARQSSIPAAEHAIDRMVRNVRIGHFERSLPALTAAGTLVTAAEICFEHDRASFGNKMMWVPVALGPWAPSRAWPEWPATGWPRQLCLSPRRPSWPTACRAPT